MSKRSSLSLALTLFSACVLTLFFTGCGQNYYFANRGLPPSGIANRVLVAIQNPGPGTKGALQILDAYYDIRHSYSSDTTLFFISGYPMDTPVTIQNLPEQQAGVVYGSGGGNLAIINYGSEKYGSLVSGLDGPSSSVYAARNQEYFVAANQAAHALTLIDETVGGGYTLNVPDVYKVSINSSGTVAMGFVQNSNSVYTVIHLTAVQQQQLSGGPSSWPSLLPAGSGATVQDCEPQNLPSYCAVRIADPSHLFDRPIKAVFSSDGSTAWVINCGPECGGTHAGIVTVPLVGSVFNTGATGPAALGLVPSTVTLTPGGATDILQNGNTLYAAGQQLQTTGPFAGLFAGNLTVMGLNSTNVPTVQSTVAISDGNHNKMVLGDDNTLWVGSQQCEDGVRYAESQAGNTTVALGCLTMFNTATNTVTSIDTYKGDLTGLTAILGLYKVYVAEGGQVHIYNTSNGSERDNSGVTVTGTAYDVAYMDAPSDGDNANY